MVKRKGSSKLNETEIAIDFLRTMKEKAPKGNEIIGKILCDNEKTLLDQHFQLSRQAILPAGKS